MSPVSPVIPGKKDHEVVYAKDQPQYLPLPAYRSAGGLVITRWRLSLFERIRVLMSGSVWLSILTFGHPLQPVKLQATCPEQEEGED